MSKWITFPGHLAVAMAQSPSSSYKSKATPAESQPLLSADHLFFVPRLIPTIHELCASNYKESCWILLGLKYAFEF
jgi:hypothetical protein